MGDELLEAVGRLKKACADIHSGRKAELSTDDLFILITGLEQTLADNKELSEQIFAAGIGAPIPLKRMGH